MSTQQPLACHLSALKDDQLEQHKANSRDVFNSVQDWRELPDGYALNLPIETGIIEKAGAFIARERLCCPFFNFTLEITPEHGPVWLKITNEQQEQVKKFVEKNIITQLKQKHVELKNS